MARKLGVSWASGDSEGTSRTTALSTFGRRMERAGPKSAHGVHVEARLSEHGEGPVVLRTRASRRADRAPLFCTIRTAPRRCLDDRRRGAGSLRSPDTEGFRSRRASSAKLPATSAKSNSAASPSTMERSGVGRAPRRARAPCRGRARRRRRSHPRVRRACVRAPSPGPSSTTVWPKVCRGVCNLGDRSAVAPGSSAKTSASARGRALGADPERPSADGRSSVTEPTWQDHEALGTKSARQIVRSVTPVAWGGRRYYVGRGRAIDLG